MTTYFHLLPSAVNFHLAEQLQNISVVGALIEENRSEPFFHDWFHRELVLGNNPAKVAINWHNLAFLQFSLQRKDVLILQSGKDYCQVIQELICTAVVTGYLPIEEWLVSTYLPSNLEDYDTTFPREPVLNSMHQFLEAGSIDRAEFLLTHFDFSQIGLGDMRLLLQKKVEESDIKLAEFLLKHFIKGNETTKDEVNLFRLAVICDDNKLIKYLTDRFDFQGTGLLLVLIQLAIDNEAIISMLNFVWDKNIDRKVQPFLLNLLREKIEVDSKLAKWLDDRGLN